MQYEAFLISPNICKSTKLRKNPAKRTAPESPKLQAKQCKVDYPPSPTQLAREHSYFSSPENVKCKMTKLQKKVKALEQRVRRREKKIQNMKQLFQSLKSKQLVMEEQLNTLTENFGGVAQHLFQTHQKNVGKGNPHANRYDTETKQFAMTLHYYSPRAYDYVRKLLSLPHPSSIRAWAASVDCEPGYLTNVIKLLGEQVYEKRWMADVALVVDAMSLHKMTIWDGAKKCYIGLVDYGRRSEAIRNFRSPCNQLWNTII